MIIKLVNPKGKVTYKKFHDMSTAMQVKKNIMHYNCDGNVEGTVADPGFPVGGD